MGTTPTVASRTSFWITRITTEFLLIRHAGAPITADESVRFALPTVAQVGRPSVLAHAGQAE